MKSTGNNKYLRCLLAGLWLWTIQASAKSVLSADEFKYQHLMPFFDEFPGTTAEDAEFVTETHLFSLHYRDFSELRMRVPPENRASTGLYRVPGKPIRAKATAVTESNGQEGVVHLRIGAHTDTLEHIEPKSRKRPSIASYKMPLFSESAIVHGQAYGLIYIESAITGNETFEVEIEGAVRAPWFKLNRDSLAEWQNRIRDYPAPWAELQGEHAILTLPSAMIRDLDDPEPVVRAYDQLVIDANRFAGLHPNSKDWLDRAPELPVRFVLDCQTTFAEAAHNGYPIVLYWLRYKKNPYHYLQPAWILDGYLVRHELGHNYEPLLPGDNLSHQPDTQPVLQLGFETPGSTQVFANLQIYAHQFHTWYFPYSIAGSPPDYSSHLMSGTLPKVNLFYYFPILIHFNKHLERLKGKSVIHELWTEDYNQRTPEKNAFLLTLLDYYGPGLYTQLYKNFRRLPATELPETQQQRTDYFYQQLCLITGQDLTPVFKFWEVPVSDETILRVQAEGYNYPQWIRHSGL